MFDGTGFAESMLGLEGFRMLDVDDISGGDLVIRIETVTTFVGCGSCGVRAVPQERRIVVCRDLECGTALVDVSGRVGQIEKLGVDETLFRAADQKHRTRYVTALVGLDRRVVATDMTGFYRVGMKGVLGHALKVVDGFHVVQAANGVVTAVRCRVQNELFGHRGRKGEPLYKTRKLLLTGDERLTGKGRTRLLEGLRFGDPNVEVLGVWLAKEMVRDVYLTDDVELAEVLLSRTVKACATDPVLEIRTLG